MLENRKKISFSASVLNCIPHHVVHIIYFSESVKESNSKEKNISVKYWLITFLNRNYTRKMYIIHLILFMFLLPISKGYSSSDLISSKRWENSIMSSSLCSLNTFSWISSASFFIHFNCCNEETVERLAKLAFPYVNKPYFFNNFNKSVLFLSLKLQEHALNIQKVNVASAWLNSCLHNSLSHVLNQSPKTLKNQHEVQRAHCTFSFLF